VEFSGVRGQVLDIPDVQFFVFSSSGNVFSIRGDGDRVNVGFMSFEGVLDLNAGVPDFQSSIPSDSGEVRRVRLSFGGGFNLW